MYWYACVLGLIGEANTLVTCELIECRNIWFSCLYTFCCFENAAFRELLEIFIWIRMN